MESISFAANKMAATARTDPREHLAVNTGYQCLIEPQLGRGKVFDHATITENSLLPYLFPEWK